MRRSLFTAVILVWSLIPAHSASVPSNIATAQVAQISDSSAIIEISNNSGKQVSAYTLAVTEKYKDGHVNRHEMSSDAGFNDNNPVLIPSGGFSRETDNFTNFPGNPVIQVTAELVAVVFIDQTSTAVDQAALQRLADNRHRAALSFQAAADAIARAIGTGDPSPSRGAIQDIQRRLNAANGNANSSTRTPELPTALMSVIDDLQSAPQTAARMGITEPEYLQQKETHLIREVNRYSALANIKRMDLQWSFGMLLLRRASQLRGQSIPSMYL